MILRWYIFKEVGFFSLASLAVFTGVLTILRMLKLTDLVVNKGVAVSDIIVIFISILPTFLEVAIPLSCLLGVMLAISRMSGDSELIVIRASGCSFRTLLIPVLMFSAFAAVITFVVSAYLRPLGFRTMGETLFKLARNQSTASLSQGIFQNIGGLSIYSEEIDPKSGVLKGVLIHDKRFQDQQVTLMSSLGHLSSKEDDMILLIKLIDGVIISGSGRNLSLTQFDNNTIAIDPFKSTIVENARDQRTRELLPSQLDRKLKRTKRKLRSLPLNDSRSSKLVSLLSDYEMEWYRKFSFPAATLIFGLLGLPLGINPARTQKNWGATLSILTGLLLITTYFGILSITTAYGKKTIISPWIALWLPNLVFFALTVCAIRIMAKGRWNSIAEYLSHFFKTTKLRERS